MLQPETRAKMAFDLLKHLTTINPVFILVITLLAGKELYGYNDSIITLYVYYITSLVLSLVAMGVIIALPKIFTDRWKMAFLFLVYSSVVCFLLGIYKSGEILYNHNLQLQTLDKEEKRYMINTIQHILHNN
jgi:hypothetical protein